MTYPSGLAHERVVLECAHFYMQNQVSEQVLQEIGQTELSAFLDHEMDQMVMRLHSMMLGSEPVEVSVTARAYAAVEYPAPTIRNLFMVWLKRDLEGGVVLKRWADKIHPKMVVEDDRDVQTEHTSYFLKVCPHIAIPNNRPHIEFMLDRTEPS